MRDRAQEARGPRRVGDLFAVPALRLGNGEEEEGSKQQARKTRDEEGGAPAVMLLDLAAEEEGQQQTDIEAGGIDRERAGALFGLIEVGDHRLDRGTRAGLAHAGEDGAR